MDYSIYHNYPRAKGGEDLFQVIILTLPDDQGDVGVSDMYTGRFPTHGETWVSGVRLGDYLEWSSTRGRIVEISDDRRQAIVQMEAADITWDFSQARHEWLEARRHDWNNGIRWARAEDVPPCPNGLTPGVKPGRVADYARRG